MNTASKKLRVILTGATGMVGEGVLHECLLKDSVEKVLVLNRKPCGISHSKLTEIIHPNFFDIQPLEAQLTGYDTCFFCLGVSSVGMEEEKFYQMTYILTMHFAQTVVKLNPGITFCYISGAGTDSSEKGRIMWARVKGKTENALVKLNVGHVYNFRPAILQPTRGLKNTLPYYKYLGWLLPVVRLLMPKYICTLGELGKAMIHTASHGYPKTVLEVKDIIAIGK